MKIVKKIIMVIFILICISSFYMPKCYAIEDPIQVANISITDILNKAKGFKNAGAGNTKISIQEAEEELLPMGPILVAAASVVLVVVTGIMGIRWIIANPKEKGKLKQQMIGLAVAIVVVYGATGIWIFARSVLNGL